MYHSEHDFKPIEGLPDEAYWHLIEDAENRRGERLRADKEFWDAAKRLREESLGRLHSLIGEENLARYLKLHDRRIRRTRSTREQIARTGKGVKQLEEERLRNIRATAELAERAGVSESSVRAIQKELAEGHAALVGARTAQSPAPPGVVPKSTKCDEYVLGPPFVGHHTYHRSHSTEDPHFRRCGTECDVDTGRMKLESEIRIHDAGNHGLVSAANYARLYGRLIQLDRSYYAVTVRPVFENLRSSAHGSGTAECGWGSYHVQNNVNTEVRVQHLDPITMEIRVWSSIGRLTGEDGGPGLFQSREREGIHAWDVDFWRPEELPEPGERVYTDEVTFSGPFRGSQIQDFYFLSVSVGLCASNHVTVDDYRIDDHLLYELKLSSINVELHRV